MTPVLAQRSRADRAFERLYQRHVADVYRYSLAVLRNPADAEDVTQTTFLNAYRAFQRGERPDTPQNWLIKIAHNVCRQRFRTSARKPQEVAFDDDVGVAIVEHEDGPTAQDIQRALGELAFNQRAALIMRELEGRSYAEIGEILGLSLGAVETLIFRARRALREQLEGSLTCHEAELAISRQLDGRLSRAEKGVLRAHLRTCDDCATFARSQRAQRSALKALAAVPLPGSLASFFGGSVVGAGTIALKAGAVAAIFVAAGAVTSVGTQQIRAHHEHAAVAAVAGVASTAEPISRPTRYAGRLDRTQTLAGRPLTGARKTEPKTPSRSQERADAVRTADRSRAATASSHGESQGRALGQTKPRTHGRAFAKAAPKSHAKAHGRAHAKVNSRRSSRPKSTFAPPPRARAARAAPPPQSQKPKSNPDQGNANGNGNPPEHKEKSLPVPTPPVPQVTLPTPPAEPVGELKKPKK